jgi:hypothetical protein
MPQGILEAFAIQHERTLAVGKALRQTIELGDAPCLHPLVHGREQPWIGVL